jgi:hypothetical protein
MVYFGVFCPCIFPCLENAAEPTTAKSYIIIRVISFSPSFLQILSHTRRKTNKLASLNMTDRPSETSPLMIHDLAHHGAFEPSSTVCTLARASQMMVYLLGRGQLGQVHWPFGQLQVPDDEHPQSLMVTGVMFLFFSFGSCGFKRDEGKAADR